MSKPNIYNFLKSNPDINDISNLIYSLYAYSYPYQDSKYEECRNITIRKLIPGKINERDVSDICLYIINLPYSDAVINVFEECLIIWKYVSSTMNDEYVCNLGKVLDTANKLNYYDQYSHIKHIILDISYARWIDTYDGKNRNLTKIGFIKILKACARYSLDDIPKSFYTYNFQQPIRKYCNDLSPIENDNVISSCKKLNIKK